MQFSKACCTHTQKALGYTWNILEYRILEFTHRNSFKFVCFCMCIRHYKFVMLLQILVCVNIYSYTSVTHIKTVHMYAWQQNSREHQARETAVIDFQAAGESHHVHREGEQPILRLKYGYGVWWMAEEPQNCQRTYWYEYFHWYSGFHQFPDLPPAFEPDNILIL